MNGCSFISNYSPVAYKGMLDLREWDFKQYPSVTLDGQWEFYWQKYLITDSIFDIREEDKMYIQVPGSWNGYNVDKKKLNGIGYATYRLVILLNRDHPNLSLKLQSFGSAYELFIDGKLEVQNGIVGKSINSTVPYALPIVHTFGRDKFTNELVITIQVANFHHKEGGFWLSARLGESNYIKASRDRLVAVDILLVGGFLILSVYHLGIFLLRRRTDYAALYFSIVGVLIGLRVLLTDEKYLLHLFPFLPWELTIRLEYLTLFLSFAFYSMFFYSIYEKEYSKIVLRITQILSFFLSLLVLITPPIIFTETLLFVQMVALAGGLYFLYALFKAAMKMKAGSKVFIAGFIVLFLTASNDILHNLYVIRTGYFASYGLLFFIFAQSFVLSIRYASSYSEIEEHSEDLEKQVAVSTSEIIAKNQALEEQKQELEKKNQNITASINYASRIQQAIIGSEEAVTSNFRDSFILFEPKDIVSGDFFWYTEVKRSSSNLPGAEHKTLFFKIVAAADCTGHGIPGAFMTVLGNALLDEIINENRITNPGKVLSLLDRKLLMKLQKQNVNDGMDISMLIFDDENKKVTFSGANNPLYYVKNGQMNVVKGSKFPIGSSQYKMAKKFETHSIDLEEEDRYYIFSDGFQDQFGGEDGRKYYTKNFREFLQSICHLPMKDQKNLLKEELLRWKGDNPQTDDILVIGIKV